MTFFNKKEEVIDLILTRHGREKLAVGKFKPTHYDFFDDDIIYDMKTLPSPSSAVELQNDIADRIKTVPVLKNQTDLRGTKKDTDLPIHAPHLYKSLGKTSVFDDEKPAWHAQARQGKISGSVTYIPLEFPTSSLNSLGTFWQEKVPQLDVVCEYSFTRTEVSEQPGLNILWMRKTSDDILLEFEEKNVGDTEDNFIIEVFEYEKDGNGKIIDARPLKFSVEDFNDGTVEYYFDITTDADAESTIDIKYVDQPLEKSIEVDRCVAALESSCAKEKIEELKIQLNKLKEQNETIAAQAAQATEAALFVDKCSEHKHCPKGFICVGAVKTPGYISKFGNCVPADKWKSSAKVVSDTQGVFGKPAGKCDVTNMLTTMTMGGLGGLLFGTAWKDAADKAKTYADCQDLRPLFRGIITTPKPAGKFGLSKDGADKVLATMKKAVAGVWKGTK